MSYPVQGDRLEVSLVNGLQTTWLSLHFHGFEMRDALESRARYYCWHSDWESSVVDRNKTHDWRAFAPAPIATLIKSTGGTDFNNLVEFKEWQRRHWNFKQSDAWEYVQIEKTLVWLRHDDLLSRQITIIRRDWCKTQSGLRDGMYLSISQDIALRDI